MNRNVRFTSATATAAAAVAVVWLALPAGLQARPSFANVAGEWALDGDIRRVVTVGGLGATQRDELPVSLARFDEHGTDFAMLWIVATDPPTPPVTRIEGNYKQKNKKVTATRIESAYFEDLVRTALTDAGIAGGTITQGPSKLNITVVNNDTLKGEVQIQYRVTAGDVRGNVILKMKFVGARVPASPP